MSEIYMCPCGCRKTWNEVIRELMQENPYGGIDEAERHLRGVAKRCKRPMPPKENGDE